MYSLLSFTAQLVSASSASVEMNVISSVLFRAIKAVISNSIIARNKTEEITFISTEADEALTNWAVKLSKEYISISTNIYKLQPGAGSDYMSFTQLGYPSAFATEGNPLVGDFDPYIHGVNDTMDIDDEHGVFSLDHMARFSELAIAFAIEQGGWDNTWR